MQAYFSQDQLPYGLGNDPGVVKEEGGALAVQHDDMANAVLNVFRQNDVSVIAPPLYGMELLQRVHTPSYLRSLALAHDRRETGREQTLSESGGNVSPSPHDWLAAQGAAYSAAAAAKRVSGLHSTDLIAFSLSYPSGRHAHSDRSYVGCYVNNAAVAAATLLERCKKVVVLSLGVRHADGIQEIFYHRSDIMTISLHANSPANTLGYTGASSEIGRAAGYGYNLNFLLSKKPSGNDLLRLMDDALDVLHDYRPQAIVFAFNFQGGGGDNCNDLPLDMNVGRVIGERMVALNLPTAIVLEVDGNQAGRMGSATTDFLHGLVSAVALVRHL